MRRRERERGKKDVRWMGGGEGNGWGGVERIGLVKETHWLLGEKNVNHFAPGVILTEVLISGKYFTKYLNPSTFGGAINIFDNELMKPIFANRRAKYQNILGDRKIGRL